MMKKVFNSLSLLSLVSMMSMQVVSAQEELIVHKTDGVSIESSELENIQRITFPDGEMLVVETWHATSLQIALDEIAKLSFGEMQTTETTAPPLAPPIDVAVYITAQNEIVVESPAAIQSLALYNVDGKMLRVATETTINASTLPTGVYLLQVKTEQGTIVKKIIKNKFK